MGRLSAWCSRGGASEHGHHEVLQSIVQQAPQYHMTRVVQSTAQHEDANAPEHAPVRGLPGAASARPEPSRASSSSGAAEHTGGPRGSVNDDEFLEDCSEAFPPPPPPAVPLPGVLPPPPAVPPPHSETGDAPEHAHAPTPWQMPDQAGIDELFRSREDLLWPPP